jgi:predicted RNA binding protein YcfA (HicA-like mRNA interferase family)
MTGRLPALPAREIIKVLKEQGFVLDRQSGSHAIFIHPDGRRTTVPIHGKRDIGKGLLR